MSDRLQRLRDFLVELKRRKVYRAAILYIVVAVGTVELADIVVPFTVLPDWTVGLVFALALFAFPIMLVLAWTYDLRGGVRRTAERGIEAGPAATTDGSGTAREAGQPTSAPASDELDPRALAVLPFDNLSGSPEAAPLVAGLHDDLLTALSKAPGLTVISRTSVKGYRDTEKRVGEIARELSVGTLLEGGVQSAGGRVRLNVQLIDARTDVHRWAETYDRALSPENIFQIQTELTKKIVESLHAQLDPTRRELGERPPTADLEAYRLYAQGQTWLDQRTGDALTRALSYFRQAIERDPSYALAWAGLAETLALMEWYEYRRPEDAPDPDQAARRAEELDPTLAEAHTSLGILHALEQDGPAALEALTRAVELRPGYAEAQIWLAWVYVVLGQPDAALEPARRSLDLNPLSPVVRVFLAEALLAVGDAEQALEHSRRACEIQPGFALAHFMDALVRVHLGQIVEARNILTHALSLGAPTANPTHTQMRAVLALTHAASGDLDEARPELSRIEGAAGELADPFAAGLVHAALGQGDEAFASFGKVTRWEPTETELIRYFFPDVLGPLREDPRYERVLREVNRSWGLETPE